MLAHPSFPWQDEAISVALHKQQVYIDLSGWSPKYFPPQLVRYANTLLRDRVLFGSDYPMITPGPLARRLRAGRLQGRGAAADPQGERRASARALGDVRRPPASEMAGLMRLAEAVRGLVADVTAGIVTTVVVVDAVALAPGGERFGTGTS